MALVELALLTYATLKQGLFDFGSAVNRTLVYGAVTFILLATFGLLEWSAEHFIPEAWHEGGAAINAGIALAPFLVIHRVREWYEHHVERVLFSGWHKAEAAWAVFVESVGHFEQEAALCRDFAGELARYAVAPAVLYMREEDGVV
ncbi:hypothetical protein GRI89_10690 [Altererythrobacter salegens]|uniref:Uncharacterized protein n=1 Tax=Croceibacterium salegens TaxID=1737568 RepID=A0A6I4SVE5_9SPHN|nr:hypothetical protein [Croceibacterium salegens]MXO60005.1 hypothetical protein [Croceibacterium salegens]